MLNARFPFTKVGKTYLGTIYRPYAKIKLSSEKVDEWIPVEVVVDTGADYTLLPRRYAFLLGVGGSETIHLYKKGVKVKIGNWESSVPLGFLERDDVPPLLGRLEALEVFDLTF